uniref:Uncharacterized protein n=1 Tax=Anguilla anguilla TaxID=7936 RepID=A0A0E9WNJ4_ANGAN
MCLSLFFYFYYYPLIQSSLFFTLDPVAALVYNRTDSYTRRQ